MEAPYLPDTRQLLSYFTKVRGKVSATHNCKETTHDTKHLKKTLASPKLHSQREQTPQGFRPCLYQQLLAFMIMYVFGQ